MLRTVPRYVVFIVDPFDTRRWLATKRVGVSARRARSRAVTCNRPRVSGALSAWHAAPRDGRALRGAAARLLAVSGTSMRVVVRHRLQNDPTHQALSAVCPALAARLLFSFCFIGFLSVSLVGPLVSVDTSSCKQTDVR